MSRSDSKCDKCRHLRLPSYLYGDYMECDLFGEDLPKELKGQPYGCCLNKKEIRKLSFYYRSNLVSVKRYEKYFNSLKEKYGGKEK